MFEEGDFRALLETTPITKPRWAEAITKAKSGEWTPAEAERFIHTGERPSS